MNLCAAPAFAKDKPGLKAKLEQVFTNFLRRDLTIETLRWKFPLRYVGTNLKLWEKPGLLMAEAPVATMRVSFKTLIAGRIHIAMMRFKNAKMYVRFDHEGKSNLIDMIKDLVAHAKADIDAQFQSVLGPQLLRVADGQVKFEIRDGVLKEMPGLFNVLKLIKRDTDEGLAFGTVNGTIDMKDGVAQTRGLIELKSGLSKANHQHSYEDRFCESDPDLGFDPGPLPKSPR